jgi:hypothetical protein
MNQQIAYLNFNPKLAVKEQVAQQLSAITSYFPVQTVLTGRFLETHKGAVVFEICIKSPDGTQQMFVESANSLNEGIDKVVQRVVSQAQKKGA